MPDHSANSIVTNPLGIYSCDGTDLVVSKAPRQAPVAVEYDEDAVMSKAMEGSFSYSHDFDDLNSDPEDSVPTSELMLTELNIGQPLSQDRSSSSFSQDFEPKTVNGQPDFVSDLSALNLDFGAELQFADLGRQNTITARQMPPSESSKNLPGLLTVSGPSSNPLLIHRLRSIRKRMNPVTDWGTDDHEEELHLDDGLTDDVLKMIAFGGESPLVKFDEYISDAESELGRKLSLNKRSQGEVIGDSHQYVYGKQLPVTIEEPQVHNDHPGVTTVAPPVSERSASLTPITEDESFLLETPTPNTRAAATRTPPLEETDPVTPDDRGRLFLQINKVANIRGLPFDAGRHPKFALCLDNGLQSVYTEPASLPAPGINGQLTAKIGQEFELTVAKDLELVLTIMVSMDTLPPPPKAVAPRRMPCHSPTASNADNRQLDATQHEKSNGSGHGSSSPIKSMKNLLLRSPKKKQQKQQARKQEELELENRLQQIEKDEEHRGRVRYERELDEFYKRTDLWRGITGPLGEYCRGYVFESHYENEIFGKARQFAIPLYNEWDKAVSDGVPKPVAELQVTMMYVPKLFASEKIPNSMRECQLKLEIARNQASRGCEGFLTQQGGDCASIWRRRWFVLRGVEMIGHHEATRKRRSNIHLDKAVAVRDTLSDDMWCIYEDRSFQVSFKDGEDISFYADTVDARDRWVKALNEIIATTSGQHRSWTDLVLESQ